MDRNERLRHILKKAAATSFYKVLNDYNLDKITVDNIGSLPLWARAQFDENFSKDPFGGFLSDEVIQMHLTPSPGGRMPEFLSKNDLNWQADAVVAQLKKSGITKDDRCLVVFSYHMLAGGWLFHEGLNKLGVLSLALGPTDTEQVIEIAKTYGFNVLVANPSFALKIGQAGGKFEKLIAAGEPFTAVPGYRQKVENALSCKAYDAYGLSETGIVAAENIAQDGLHIVEEACILEVLDPDSLEPVQDGEKGELVITSLTRETMPIIRFRTGDLTLKGTKDGKVYLPRGVFGRTDSMLKIKGVKFYPKELLFILAGTEGLNFRNYQIVVSSRQDGTDNLALRVEGEKDKVDVNSLSKALRKATGIGVNEILIEESVVGDMVVDKRFS